MFHQPMDMTIFKLDLYIIKTNILTKFQYFQAKNAASRVFYQKISSPSFNIDHIGSKTRSLGQIEGKTSGGSIFNLKIMKLPQNVCLDM